MADDVFDDGPPKKYAQAVNKSADAMDSLRKAKKGAVDVAAPDLSALKNFEQMASAQETLGQQIKRSTREIIDQAKQIGSLSSQIDNVTGAVKGFGQDLQRTASITHQYSLAMKEFKQGTEAYAQSLSLSTAKLGQASAETTKFMKATQHAYNEAYNVAKIYGIEIDQVRQHMNKLQVTFASQLSVTNNHGKALVRLTKDAMMFARTAGIDTSEAIQRMDERLRASNMTMEEVRVEQILVMKEMDNYKKKLQALGKEALKTGNITSKDLVKALQQVRQEFKAGAYDAGSFAKAFTSITLKGKKLGLTTEQITGTMTGFSKVIQGLSSQEGYVGMVGSLEMLEKFGGLEGNIGKVARAQQADVRSGDTNVLQAGEAILEASKGSTEAMRLLIGIMKKSMPSQLRGFQLKEMTGSALQATLINKMINEGTYEKIFEKQAGMTKEDKAKEAAAFATPMEKLVKEAHTAQSTRHKTAKALDDLKKTVTAWMEKYWYMMAAFQIGGSLIGRGGGGLISGGARGAAGTGVRGAVGRVARGAGTALAIGATFKGLQTAYSTYKKGDKLGAAATVAASPLIGGYQYGMSGEKAIGKEIASGMSAREQTTLGKDTSLTNILATMAMDNKLMRFAITKNTFALGAQAFLGVTGRGTEMDINKKGWEMIKKERIGMDWEAFNQQKDLYKIKEKEIQALEAKKSLDKYLSKAEQDLLDKKKEELRLMEKKVTGLKRAIDEEKGTGERFKKEAQQDINEALLALGRGRIKSRTDVQARMDAILKQSSRMRKGGRAAMESQAGKSIQGAMLRKFMQQAEAAGISKEQFGEMWAKRAATLETQMGASRMLAHTPLTAPPGAIDNLKQQEKVKVEVVIVGDDKGSSGEETVTTRPDGGYTKNTRLTAGLNVKVNVPGETVKTKAFHEKKIRMRQQGNKQAG